MVIALAILVLAIVVAMTFGRWLLRKGTDMERGGKDHRR